MITTTNPRTGIAISLNVDSTPYEEVVAIAERAQSAAPALASLGRAGRARLLDQIAAEIETRRAHLVDIADQETGLGADRLNGELNRSIFQFQLFAETLREGSYLEAMIDLAADTTLGAGADLRRMLVPVGPVAVFGASNFPFAFSVLGGDTAAAIAAGCPAVLKVHSSHPRTSILSFDALMAAAKCVDAPIGTFELVLGQEPGSVLVTQSAIKAVCLTGSLGAAMALQRAINTREDPIPLYGELSSLNPLVVAPEAARARSEQIAGGLFGSFTGSSGQFCTKPGVAFIPTGVGGDRLVATLSELVQQASGAVMLNRRTHESFQQTRSELIASGAPLLAEAEGIVEEDGFRSAPTLLVASAKDLTEQHLRECFGPLLVVARYGHPDELKAAFRHLPQSLTATIHSENEEAEFAAELTSLLESVSGRMVYNDFPTGVRVSWAQHHGGQWPATNSIHSSVGSTSIRRFLRPFAWQNAPQSVLPAELRDGDHEVPRRINGRLRLPVTYD